MEETAIYLADVMLDIPEEKEGWQITDDLTADWALDKIRDTRAEYNRFEMVAKAKIRQIEEALAKKRMAMESETGFFESKLREYFETVKTKDTKTQKSYSLPSGRLKLKYQNPEYKRDEEVLLSYLESNNMSSYVKLKKSTDWSNLKKLTDIAGGKVVNKETGEIIPGIELVERDPKFEVEV